VRRSKPIAHRGLPFGEAVWVAHGSEALRYWSKRGDWRLLENQIDATVGLCDLDDLCNSLFDAPLHSEGSAANNGRELPVWGTAMTMQSPKPSTVSTRPRSSTGAGLGGRSRLSIATLEWVDWFNNRGLLEPIGNIPPTEAEKRYYAMTEQPAMAA
jgi:transposase InsO family protein